MSKLEQFFDSVGSTIKSKAPKLITREIPKHDELLAYYPGSIIKESRDGGKPLHILNVTYYRADNTNLNDIVPIMFTGYVPFVHHSKYLSFMIVGVFEETQELREYLMNNPRESRSIRLGKEARLITVSDPFSMMRFIFQSVKNMAYVIRQNTVMYDKNDRKARVKADESAVNSIETVIERITEFKEKIENAIEYKETKQKRI